MTTPRSEIDAALVAVAKEKDVRLLFAAESGSRAWGFASPDSDYDVRFIYAHDLDWYLSVTEKRDVIERFLPGDLDLAGWEMRKALALFRKCNLALNEWLGSPIVYADPEGLGRRLRELMPASFNPIKAMHHYLSMAAKVRDEHLSKDEVNLKKLFYVLRPMLACRWILREGSMPPTAFADLAAEGRITDEERGVIDGLLERKRAAVDGGLIPAGEAPLAWIDEQLESIRAATAALKPPPRASAAPLDELLREAVLRPRGRCYSV